MEEEPGITLILGTVLLYMFVGFSLGWIVLTYGEFNSTKNAGMKKKPRSSFLDTFFQRVGSPQLFSLACIDDIEAAAKQQLDPNKWLLFNDVAGNGYTASENIIAFKRYSLMPKALVDVSKFSFETKVLNRQIQFPICMAPLKALCMAHADGDVISAQVAQQLGTVFVHSAHAQTSIVDIATAAPDAIKWLQVYLYNPLVLTLELVKLAEEHGYAAIVITIDKPVAALKHNSRHYLVHKQSNHFPNINLISKKLGLNTCKPKDLCNPTQTWDQAKEVTKHTKLPIVLKGILNKDDVKMASHIGAKAVVVSNHGGRALDGVPASIEALEDVVREAREYRLEVYMDGGVRTGTDVFKALALGAQCVFVGRPLLWGLACSGKTGLSHVLDILRKELENTAQLCGAESLQHIERGMVEYVGRG